MPLVATKALCPVEEYYVLSRYGEGGESVAVDRLGGEGWQRPAKSKLKERIRAIAHELLRTAAARALATGAAPLPAFESHRKWAGFRGSFPLSRKPDDQQQA